MKIEALYTVENPSETRVLLDEIMAIARLSKNQLIVMRLEIVDLGLIFIVGPQDRYEELPESLNQKLQTAESDDIEGEIYVALGRAKYLLNELGTAIQLFNKGLMHLKSPKSTGRSLPTIGSVPIPAISFKSVKGLNRPKVDIRA